MLDEEDAPAVIDRLARVVAAPDRAVQRHDRGHRAVDLLGGLLLVRLDVPGGVGADEDVVHHPPEHRVPRVRDAFSEHQLHELLGRRAHVLEALSEGDHGEAHALEVLHHLHGPPAVEGDLADVEALAQVLDEALDVAVVHDVALGRLDMALAPPHVVGDVVAPDAQVDALLGDPEVGQHVVAVLVVQWREHQHERRDVGRGRQVQASVAHPALEGLGIDRERAQVPFLHRHPAHGLLHPLVEPQLAEDVLLARILARALTCGAHLLDRDGLPQRGVGLFPDLRIRPVLALVGPVDHRVEGAVVLAALQDIARLLVLLMADGVRVASGRGDQKEQRLGARVARALGHHVEELAVGLGVQLVEHHAVDVEAVLGVRLGREHLVEAVVGQVHDALGGGQYLHTPVERGAHAHHVGGDLENDRGLLAVGGAAVHLGALLEVGARQQQRHGGGELALAVLLGDLDIRGVELPVPVRLDHAEEVADDPLLPGKQDEGPAGPDALGVAQALDEVHGVVGLDAVVGRVLRRKRSGCVFLELWHGLPVWM